MMRYALVKLSVIQETINSYIICVCVVLCVCVCVRACVRACVCERERKREREREVCITLALGYERPSTLR